MIKRSYGFTLIETMITVAIIAILASIAYPAYQDYVLRGQLTEASDLLNADRVLLEQFYQDNRSYATVGVNPTPCGGGGANDFTKTPGNYFTIACVVGGGGTTYTITANGSKPNTAQFSYNINQTGVQTTVSVKTSWLPLPAPNTCWMMKKGQTC